MNAPRHAPPLDSKTPPTADAIDLDTLRRELDAMKREIRAAGGEEDLAHLNKIERWGRICTALGYAGAWIVPNPVSAALLSQGRVTRWAMVAHHVSHRGYDHVPNVPEHRKSRSFAKGWGRRVRDWFDWIDPEAWAEEHNKQHHYRLGEEADPDLVEHNLDWLRDSDLPRGAKLAIIAFFASTWKWTYYAPNTLRILQEAGARRRGEQVESRSLTDMWKDPELYRRCLLPYAVGQFVVVPLAFLPLGPVAAANVWVNSMLAEWFTNLHTFVIITTNHAGDDMHAFDTPIARGKGEFYFRQIVGSTNFRTGSDFNDFLHGFLNYQIEHHIFPDLSMRQYQRIQPRVRQLCERLGVPYVQESVWRRLAKTLRVMTGDADMLRPERGAA